MRFDFNAWIGQVTTGHGVMIIGPTLLSVASGTMGWQTATPLLVAGTVGLLWPENTPLKTTAQAVATDVTALIAAYRTGVNHANQAAATMPPQTEQAAAPRSGAVAAALALSLAAAATLSGCANQTSTQQAAGAQAIASGVLCLADASGKVVATATTSDPNSVKAANAAVAAGSVLTTDAACQTAVTNSVAALPTNSTGH